LATAAGVKYPAALLRYKLDAPSACCGVFDWYGGILAWLGWGVKGMEEEAAK